MSKGAKSFRNVGELRQTSNIKLQTTSYFTQRTRRFTNAAGSITIDLICDPTDRIFYFTFCLFENHKPQRAQWQRKEPRRFPDIRVFRQTSNNILQTGISW